MSDPSALPHSITRFLRAYVLRARRLEAVRGLGWSAAALAGLLLCGCLVDRVIPMAFGVRIVWLVLTVLVSLLLLLRPLLRLQFKIDWVAAASGIEQHNPVFHQRLLTLVSRTLGRTDYSGSPELLDELAFGLERDAKQQRPRALLPARVIVPPWLLLAGIVLMAAALARSSELNLPQLARRLLLPWRPIPAVTTTQVQVVPGDLDVLQGGAAKIEAAVTRLHGGSVFLNFSEGNDEEWQRIPMVPADDAVSAAASSAGPISGRFTYTVPSVDRDLRYFVSAGDAVSGSYTLRVLRRPAISQFRFRYTYAPFTGKPPAIVLSRDGRIEAPMGTEVQLTIIATEPLQSALLTVNGEKQLMTPVADVPDAFTRQGKLTVTGNGRYDIDLITVRQQTGTGPATTEIRALPDRSPVVRLTGSKSIVRLGAFDVLPLAFEASDDFGIDSLGWRVTTASGNIEFPAWPYVRGAGGSAFNSIRGDRRRLEGLAELDLGLLPLTPGDVASVTLVARDSGKHATESDPLTVLVTRGATSPYLYEHAAELKAAAQWLAAAADGLDQAFKAVPDNPSDDSGSARGRKSLSRALRSMRSATDSLALARRSLLRAMARSTCSDLNNAIEAWLDQANETARLLDQAYRGAGADTRDHPATRSASPSTAPLIRSTELRQLCRQSLDRVTGLRDVLKSVAASAQAATLAADLQNLADADHRRNGQQVQAIRKEVTEAAKGLGLNESAKDLPSRLRELIDRGRSVARAQSRLNLATAITEWAAAVDAETHPLPAIADRLFAAARAHAERPDADPAFARDLNLAGLAAAEIAGGTAPSAGAAREVAAAFSVLAIEHHLHQAGDSNSPASDAVAAAADAARDVLHARESGRSVTTPAVRTARIEAIALAANASAAAHNFEASAALDRQLAKLAAGQLDATVIATAQQSLQRARAAADMAARVEQLVALVPQDVAPPDPAARERAAAALTSIAERLTDIVAQIAPVGSSRVIAIAEGSRRDRRGAALNLAVSRIESGPFALAMTPTIAAARRAAEISLSANDPLTAAKWAARRIAENPGRLSDAARTALTSDLRLAQSRLQRYASVQRLTAVRTIRPSALADSATESARNAATRPTVRAPLPGLGMTDLLPSLPLQPDLADEGFNDPEWPGYEPALRAYREATRKANAGGK